MLSFRLLLNVGFGSCFRFNIFHHHVHRLKILEILLQFRVQVAQNLI